LADRLCGGQVIVSAGVLTLIMFGGLSILVFATKADFSFLRMFLMWGGILALGIVLCGALFQFQIGMWFSVAMIALASGYILYDTSNVLHHYRTDQHVAASLALFASVALLFWYVLRLLIQLQGRD
jgi:FtsH-binding integral membrane protein